MCGRTSLFTVVTTEPNVVVEPLHHRMAAVLDPEEQQRWLSTADQAVLDPPPAEWHAYPVSTRVNDPTNDDPAVVERIEPDTQTGLDEFVAVPGRRRTAAVAGAFRYYY